MEQWYVGSDTGL